MNDSQKIEELLHYFRMEQKDFAEKCGFKANVLSKIKREDCGISKKVFNKILTAFPEVNENWLKNGVEPMIIKNEQKVDTSNSHLTNSPVMRDGNTLTYTVSSDEVTKISFGYQDIIKQQQNQMNDLIDIIKDLSKK